MHRPWAISERALSAHKGRLAWPLLALLLCGALLWPQAARWAYDDPYITYRYTENLLRGAGFVYNPGLRVLSTTTPGYTLLLTALGALWPDLPLLSNLLGLLAALGCGLLVVALLPHDLGALPATLTALLAGLLAPAYTALGSEMSIYTLLILAALLLAERKHPLAAGIVAGLASVVRPDGVLAAAVVTLAFWRQPRALLLAAAGAALAAGPWYLFSLGYFGSPIPATLAAKRAQLAQIAGSASFLDRLAQTLIAYGRQPWYWPALALLACGVWALARQRRAPLIVGWAALYVIAYGALGVSGYAWYVVPIMPALAWLVGYGLWWVLQMIGDRQQATGNSDTLRVAVPGEVQRRWLLRRQPGHSRRKLLLQVLVSLLLLAPIAGAAQGLVRLLSRAPEPRALVYSEAGSWLAANTPAEASVGALEVGIIGYYSRRPMVDFAGLIQPEVSASEGKSYSDWGEAAIRRYRPDFVAVPSAFGATLSAQPWFAASYAPRKQFTASGYADPLVVYERH